MIKTEQETTLTNIFDDIAQGNINGIRDAVASKHESVFLRNELHQTPLSVAIQRKSADCIQALVEGDAMASVFVKGYAPKSLVCTLPMAMQPQSSVFQHPEALTVDGSLLDQVDEALASHITSSFEAFKTKSAKDAAEAESAKEEAQRRMASDAGASSSTSTPLAPKKTFNHFPATLKVGDIVRRGKGWHWSGQDTNGGVEHAGVVKTVSGMGMQIEWRTDVSDPSSGFHTNSYSYSPTTMEVFLVDPSDPKAVPKGLVSKVLAPADKFKVGDRVQLVPDCKESALISSSGVDKESLRQSSRECLGRSDEGRVGVIVKVLVDEHTGSRAKGARRFAPGEPDHKLTILGLPNSTLCDYASSDVRYADGSMPGELDPVTVVPRAIGTTFGRGSKKPKGVFQPGDRVKLRNNASDLRGCLGEPSYGWIGTIGSSPSPGASSIHVLCSSASGGRYPNLSGNYPNHHYKPDELMHEDESEVEGPLVIGDRVMLDDGFADNNGDGWCLGAAGSGKIGVVLFAPSPSTNKGEQRDIVVASLDQPQSTYRFRAQWLQRAPNVGSIRFKVGDRVQLDAGMWSPAAAETGGKCLGTPTDLAYGIVCGSGVIRDGVARNIEVMAITGERAGDVSLYPAYSITRAVRQCLLTETEHSSLVQHVNGFLASLQITSVDPAELVTNLGLGVWDRLYELTLSTNKLPREAFFAAWMRWSQRRDLSWSPSEGTHYSASLDQTMKGPGGQSEDTSALLGSVSVVAGFGGEAVTISSANAATWQCPKCRFDSNPSKKSKCVMCKVGVIPKWTCSRCSTMNKCVDGACVSCCTTVEESGHFSVVKAEEKRRADIAAKVKHEKEEAARMKREAAAEAARRESEAKRAAEDAAAGVEVPAGRFRHPGSYENCGGNPTGFAKCAGGGKCTTGGPGKCLNCGAGTHWTCCTSQDQDSLFCLEGITFEQAENNAQVLAAESSTYTRVVDIAGFFSSEVPSDWSCGGCTMVNPLSSKKCSVCNTANPHPPAATPQADASKKGKKGKDKKEQSSPPLEPFDHPGSYGGCGGNKDGTVASSGGGNCSGGCQNCGRRTHWSCCGDTESSSKKCLPGFTKAQAEANTKIFRTGTSGAPVKVSSLPGVVLDLSSVPIASKVAKGSSQFVTSLSAPLRRLADSARVEKGALKREKDKFAALHQLQKDKKKFVSKGSSTPHSLCAITGSVPCRRCGMLGPSSQSSNMYCSVCDECAPCCSKSPGNCKGTGIKTTGTHNVDKSRGGEKCSNCDQKKGSHECSEWHCTKCKWCAVCSAVDVHCQADPRTAAAKIASNDDDDDDDEEDDEDNALVEDDDDDDVAAQVADGSTKLPGGGAVKTDNFELEYNAKASEIYFNSPSSAPQLLISSALGPYDPTLDDDADDDDDGPSSRPGLMKRQTSQDFYELLSYDPIKSITDLVSFADKRGQTAAHYAAQMKLHRTVLALFAAGAPRWQESASGETPCGLLDGIPPGADKSAFDVHKALGKHGLLNQTQLRAALRTPFDYTAPKALENLVAAIKSGEHDDADFLSEEAVDNNVPHAKLYRALFRIEFNYGSLIAKEELREYLDEVTSSKGLCIDPLLYYVRFLLWKKVPSNSRPSHAKRDRLLAADALKAFRAYPIMADLWLDPRERHDAEVAESGIDADDLGPEIEDDDYSDLFPPPGPNDPESIWEKAKRDYNLKSPAMDNLMKLVGLKAVKERAISVALTVLLSPPADLQTGTSMNFLFVGNPGTGKTTVATYLAEAMVELGYRKNPKPVFTSADDILGASQPVAEFAQLVKDAEGGTLFIDEAYLFDPAPKGQRANDSNKVLNMLLKVSETMRLTTTFILAGYKDEVMGLMAYNVGFPSRFPKKFTFDFVDYSELQLTKILNDMAVARKYRFESKRECGVPIARVLARRIHRSANKKGFGNARDCDRELDLCVQKQQARHVKLKLSKVHISDHDYRTLTRGDTVGDRPKLEDSVHMAELASMIGLKQVKQSMENLMNLQLQNFDAEMRGETIQVISLHRVFFGNPGTGKTTVARLYGKMLQEFGFLSDGDFIETKPSDLKGSHPGEAATNTKALLDSAKGKVVFIDEAYNLDPTRHVGSFGAEVLDTILEKIEGNAGSDMAVILAGYQPQMEELFRNCKNPGLKRRFNVGEAFYFEDFSDEDIKKVLRSQVVNAGLACEPATLEFAVQTISKKRMEDGFGNAGEAEQILGRAKLRLSARLSKPDCPPHTNHKLLLAEDFAGEETSVEKAREAFADLDHIEHITTVIDKYEGMVATALEENKKPHEEMANMHLLFLGPPGTGKTTCGKRFAQMFKQLEILPSDRFEYTTAGQLIDRYVGGTGNNTIDIMRKAKGGVLMIDEAYGMMPSKGNWFGAEIMQALLDGVTSDEFRGKIIIILGGYEEHVTELFSLNPGFQSRFDKQRIVFPSWSGEQAKVAVCNAIARDNKAIEQDAADALVGYFETLSQLPNWASARDALEIVKKNLEAERASRSFALSKERRMLEEAQGSDAGKAKKLAKGNAARAVAPPPIPYSLVDVQKVMDAIIQARGGEDMVAGHGSSNSKVRRIVNNMAYKEALATAKRSNKLLVVCFTQPSSCIHCERFAPVFDDIAAANPDISFAVVNGDTAADVFKAVGVRGVPMTHIFLAGKKVAEVGGNNGPLLRQQLVVFGATARKLQDHTAPPALPDASSGVGMALAPPPPKPTYSYAQPKARTYDDDGDGDEEKEEPGEEDFWEALEAACGELGWSLEKVKAMLEDTANFPPKEIMDIILRKTGARDVGKVKNMLGRQRPEVLIKINHSIQEAKRAKTEQEAKIQTVLKTKGKCCMGFEWLREGEGWRCAGGSHTCTDADVENWMADDDLYG